MAAFETLGKVNRYTKSSFKRSVGCSDRQVKCAEASAQGLGRAQPALISVALRLRRDYLNLKCFHPYSFKECTYYLLRKTFTHILNFSQNFWEG